jgi:hypothetical protein
MHKQIAGVVGAVALALMAATPAFAQKTPSVTNTFITQEQIWSEPMMKSMDKNKDGMVSREEFLVYMGAQYDMMDVNKDKMLDKKEFTDKKMMERTFTRQDS